MKLTLYTYFRSSAAYRVRIALNLKSVPYEMVPVHLVRDGGQHRQDWYRAINPQMKVPSLAIETDRGRVILTQSLAILEWIEETWPAPSLLPTDALLRARARSLAAAVCCDIHPVNNLGVLQYLKGPLGLGQAQVDAWYAHWIHDGFRALEAMLPENTDGPFACGSAPTLADVCLVPQVFNARRFNVTLDDYPRIRRIEAAMLALSAVEAASPARQPDAE